MIEVTDTRNPTFSIDSQEIARQFPLLQRLGPTGEPIVYLDSAATALKPQCVIDSVVDMLSNHTANIHRSVHLLGDEATEAYESTREVVAAFLNAEPNEIVFLRNTTEALNLVAKSHFASGKVVTTVAEHHSNYLPWNEQAIRLNINQDAVLDLGDLETALISHDVTLVSVSHCSNVTGVINDIPTISELAHQYGAKVLVDAAQSAPHTPLDVEELGCDFLAFSGHKLGAPTGVGVLYGKAELLEQMEMQLLGGSTIEEVHLQGFVPKNAPWKFEAGTPAIESVVALGTAIEYLLDLGMDNVQQRFLELSEHTFSTIDRELSTDLLLGSKTKNRSGPFSLSFKGISPHVIARGLSDRHGICVRSGYHCAQPLHEVLGAPASLRLSFWIYNTEAEISKAVSGIAELIDLVKR